MAGVWRVYSGWVPGEYYDAMKTYGESLDKGKVLRETSGDTFECKVVQFFNPDGRDIGKRRWMLMQESNHPGESGWLMFDDRDAAIRDYERVVRMTFARYDGITTDVQDVVAV